MCVTVTEGKSMYKHSLVHTYLISCTAEYRLFGDIEIYVLMEWHRSRLTDWSCISSVSHKQGPSAICQVTTAFLCLPFVSFGNLYIIFISLALTDMATHFTWGCLLWNKQCLSWFESFPRPVLGTLTSSGLWSCCATPLSKQFTSKDVCGLCWQTLFLHSKYWVLTLLFLY